MKQMQRTAAARAATKRIRMAMPPEERKALAIRLLAIGNGKRSQRAYRLRGVINPCAPANAARRKNAAKRRAAKALNLRAMREFEKCPQYDVTTQRLMVERTRNKINVGW